MDYVGLSFASILDTGNSGGLPREAFLYDMFNEMEMALLSVKNI
jgi:hypothetical protein